MTSFSAIYVQEVNTTGQVLRNHRLRFGRYCFALDKFDRLLVLEDNNQLEYYFRYHFEEDRHFGSWPYMESYRFSLRYIRQTEELVNSGLRISI